MHQSSTTISVFILLNDIRRSKLNNTYKGGSVVMIHSTNFTTRSYHHSRVSQSCTVALSTTVDTSARLIKYSPESEIETLASKSSRLEA
uniref:Uncharacterized protein n=1 Tax=Plectus sambesii TaxID=2011161 RepID=A0A914XH81_9BILA